MSLFLRFIMPVPPQQPCATCISLCRSPACFLPLFSPDLFLLVHILFEAVYLFQLLSSGHAIMHWCNLSPDFFLTGPATILRHWKQGREKWLKESLKHSLKQDNFPDYNWKAIMATVTFLWAKSNNIFCKWMLYAKADHRYLRALQNWH